MLGDRYIVERGDSLWKIAAKTLGGGKHWPRIWRHNNRPAVVRVTGRSIPNPDFFHVGQLLLITRLPTERITSGDPNDASSMSHLDTAAPASGVVTAQRTSKPCSDRIDPPAHNRSFQTGSNAFVRRYRSSIGSICAGRHRTLVRRRLKEDSNGRFGIIPQR